MTKKRALIEAQVMLILKPYKLKGKEITGETKIIKDLKLAGLEDLTIIDDAEKVTGSRPPKDLWENVFTVNHMVDLLEKYSPLPNNFNYDEEIEKTKNTLSHIYKGTPLGRAITIFVTALFLICWFYILHLGDLINYLSKFFR